MHKKNDSPWASGPAELLKHAASLLSKDSDANRRIAMILIDNAVEQAMKTYLSLPKRVSRITISRRQLSELSESFPALLDAMEQYAADKLAGIDLGAIEWYHRLRNELYHQGFGLTVERDKVEIYAELAQLLYQNLFGHAVSITVGRDAEMIGRAIELWNRLETALISAASDHVIGRPRGVTDAMRILREVPLLSREDVTLIDKFRKVRNQVVHAQGDYKSLLKEDLMSRIEELTKSFEQAEGIENEEA
jgi:hypothetical protein